MEIKREELEEKLTAIWEEAIEARDRAQKACKDITALKQWLVEQHLKQLQANH